MAFTANCDLCYFGINGMVAKPMRRIELAVVLRDDIVGCRGLAFFGVSLFRLGKVGRGGKPKKCLSGADEMFCRMPTKCFVGRRRNVLSDADEMFCRAL